MSEMKNRLMASFTRAKQSTAERLGRADKTTFDDDFEQQSKRSDVLKSVLDKMVKHTNHWLEPNPNRRLEANFSRKFKRKTAQRMTELEALGHSFTEASDALGSDGDFASALRTIGQVEVELGERWCHLCAVVEQRFKGPLKQFITGDIKEAQSKRKSLNTCRLDLDAIRARAKKAEALPMEKRGPIEKELSEKQAAFDRQYEAVRLLLDNLHAKTNEHISTLAALVDAQHDYFAAAADATAKLAQQLRQSAGFVPPSYSAANGSAGNDEAVAAAAAGATPVAGNDTVDRGGIVTGRVLCNFEATDGSGLVLSADDVVIVHRKDELPEGQVLVEKDGRTGRAPEEILEIQE